VNDAEKIEFRTYPDPMALLAKDPKLLAKSTIENCTPRIGILSWIILKNLCDRNSGQWPRQSQPMKMGIRGGYERVEIAFGRVKFNLPTKQNQTIITVARRLNQIHHSHTDPLFVAAATHKHHHPYCPDVSLPRSSCKCLLSSSPTFSQIRKQRFWLPL
jgi:hypothetical protein